MTRFFLILLLVMVSINVKAQFNDTTNYYYKLLSSGIINKTNDRNSYVLNNAFKFTIYKKNYSLNTNTNWIYGKQQRQLANNDFSSSLDFDVFKTNRHIYYWGLLNYEKSFSLKINHRLQAGLGIGYYIIDRESLVLQISDGILYEKSDLYNTEDLTSNDYNTYRNSFRLKFRWIIKDYFTLDNTDFIQHSLSDKNDYNIKSITTFSFRFRKWISLTIAVNYNKLNLTQRENFLLNYGLTLERYF